MTAEVTTEKLFADLQAVVRDAEALLKATAGLAGDKVQEMRARAEQTIKQARSRIDAVEEDAMGRAKEMVKVTEGYVRENPWQSIGVAAGIGLLLGVLLEQTVMSEPAEPTAAESSQAKSNREGPPEAAGIASGLFKSLTDLVATLVVFAQTRLELLTTELQEEVQRAASLVIWAFIAMLAAMLGLLFGALTIVIVYWDEHRILAAVLVTAAFLLFALAAVGILFAKFNSRPRIFDATLSELARDAQSLKTKT